MFRQTYRTTCTIILQDINKRLDAIEAILNPNKTYSEKAIEHFISPTGLELIYKTIPNAENKVKDVDTIVANTATEVSSKLMANYKKLW